jgi:hypothetical protein
VSRVAGGSGEEEQLCPEKAGTIAVLVPRPKAVHRSPSPTLGLARLRSGFPVTFTV